MTTVTLVRAANYDANAINTMTSLNHPILHGGLISPGFLCSPRVDILPADQGWCRSPQTNPARPHRSRPKR